jgi:hypothetical protein
MRAILVLLAAAGLAAPAAGQPAVRRIEPKAFPLAVALSAGLGFGGVRATYLDTLECAGNECWTAGAGSGWTAGLDLRAPLGRTLGVEIAGQVGRPSQRLCLRGQCQAPSNIWSLRGSAMLLWRFKARAPIHLGLGGAVTRFDPAPVVNQNLTADGQQGTTEFGGATVVGYDFALGEGLTGSIVWRSYLMVPSSEGLPGAYEPTSLAWDNAVGFAVRYHLGR